MSENSAKLTQGPIAKTIVKMALPMLAALTGMFIFNLTDTFFIGQLGKDQLAALTFTFPVVIFFVSLAFGIGTGTSALVSRAIGEGNHQKVKRLTTDSLLLIFLISLLAVIVGLLTVDRLFTFLGAQGVILDYVKQYMHIWFMGIIFVMIPMVGNNAIRATGDTKTPSQIMMVAIVVNLILDPILIFGYGPVPAMGIEGAAWATLFSRAITLVAALYILEHREKMITFKPPMLSEIKNSFSQILKIGMPTALTRILFPVGTGIITKMIAVYGVAAVAAFGVGSRIEIFSVSPLMALASVIGPFVGQNAGAELYDRIKISVIGSNRFAFVYGLIAWAVISFFAPQLIAIFNDEPQVIAVGIQYLYIVPAAVAFMGLLMMSSTVLNVLHRPIKSGALSIIQMFIIYIPLGLFLTLFLDLKGIFIAYIISNIIIGIISVIITFKEIKQQGNTDGSE
jgi:MATE family, multidrug efflux pump